MNREHIDIGILTILPIELAAALAALAISESAREKDEDGTIYYPGSIYSALRKRHYTLVLTCCGKPGIAAAAAATRALIEKYRPRVVVLMGIAAGIRKKLKIGEVIIAERVIAYEPAALVRSSDGTPYEEPRPDVEHIPYTMQQDIANYQANLERIYKRFEAMGGVFPQPQPGKEEEYAENVVSTPTLKPGTIASGDKLLRDPSKLQDVRQLHGKVEAGEMEAAGFVEACRPGGICWLVIRGISDFGDAFKDDQFHLFAAQTAATVLSDFIAYGLDISIPSAPIEDAAQVEDASPVSPSPVINQPFPQYLTPFVGRGHELANIMDSLRKPDCRLLTLVGPGGIGKTRLALEAVKQLVDDFNDGIYIVSLAPIISPDFILTTIIESIKMPTESQQDLKKQLLAYLQPRRVLLVMDNFEHVLDGVGILLDILQCSPGTKILATSCQRLLMQAEWLLPVEGLECPDPGHVGAFTESSAAQLFLQSVTRLHSGFQPSESDEQAIAHICHLLHGLPLGIELAAPWIRVLNCHEIANEIERNLDFLATEMHDIPERHRSLRAVFEQSWILLSDEERQVFSRLSVFRGGFEREAAEQVVHASLPTIAKLTDRSLLRKSETRYEVLEIVRQYAQEKLEEESGEKQRIRDLHAEYYAQFLEKREQLLRGKGQQIAMDEVSTEIENIRSAWQWLLTQRRIALIEKSLESLLLFFSHRNWFEEASDAFQRAAEQVEACPPGTMRNRVLSKIYWYQSRALHALSRYGEAITCCKKSLSVSGPPESSEENSRHIARAHMELAAASYSVGKYREARAIFKKSYEISKHIDAPDLMALSLLRLGDIASVIGHYKQSRHYLEKSLALLRTLNNPQQLTLCLSNLGDTLCKIGEYAESLKCFQESLKISEDVQDQWNRGIAETHLGRVFGLIGDFEEAERLCRRGLATFIKVEYTWSELFASIHLAKVLYLAGNSAEAEKLLRENLGVCKGTTYRWHLCFLLNLLGKIERERDNIPQARENFLEAIEIAMEINAYPIVLDVLAQIARIHAGEMNKADARTIAVFVLRHLATEKETEDAARKLLAEVADKQFPNTLLPTPLKKSNGDLKKFVKEVMHQLLAVR